MAAVRWTSNRQPSPGLYGPYCRHNSPYPVRPASSLSEKTKKDKMEQRPLVYLPTDKRTLSSGKESGKPKQPSQGGRGKPAVGEKRWGNWICLWGGQ